VGPASNYGRAKSELGGMQVVNPAPTQWWKKKESSYELVDSGIELGEIWVANKKTGGLQVGGIDRFASIKTQRTRESDAGRVSEKTGLIICRMGGTHQYVLVRKKERKNQTRTL